MSGHVSQEYVDRLRNMGASDYAVAFAQRHVARFSQADVDREVKKGLVIGFWWGVGLSMIVVALLQGVTA
jgi:hypothetical protein